MGPDRRHRVRRWLYGLLWLLACGSGHAQTLRIDAALSAAGSAEDFPAAAAQLVTLPDDWSLELTPQLGIRRLKGAATGSAPRFGVRFHHGP